MIGARWSAFLVSLLVVLSIAAGTGPVAADNNEINHSSDAAPGFYGYATSYTIAEHNRSEMSSQVAYYTDEGEVETLDASINQSIDNPVAIRFDKVADESLQQFPRDKDSVSWRDTAEWTTGGTNATKISVTDADGATATDVDAVTIATDGTMASGDDAHAEFSNFSITNDPEKRVLTVFFKQGTLDTGAELQLEAEDGDGDVKQLVANSSRDASATEVIANTTGGGWAAQVKLADVATSGTGDGSFDNIETVRVEVLDADASITITGMDLERKSKVTLGERLADTDSDDALETVTVEQVQEPGTVRLKSVDSMGAWADDAVLHDLKVHGLKFQLEHLASEDIKAEYDPGFQEDYSYEHGTRVYARLLFPSAIDLSPAGLELRINQSYVTDRYVSFAHKEGTGTTDLANVSNYNDDTGSLAGKNEMVVFDSTVAAGENIVVKWEVLQKPSEFDALQPTTQTATPGGGGGFWSGGGNPISSFINWLLAGIATIFGSSMLLKRRGS